jgi:hypothetical protein
MTIDFTYVLSLEVCVRAQVVGQRKFTAAKDTVQSQHSSHAIYGGESYISTGFFPRDCDFLSQLSSHKSFILSHHCL